MNILQAQALGPAVLLDDHKLNPAKWTHERIVRSIIDFEKKLDETLEIGLRLVSFSNAEVIHINDVGYWGPDLVIFYGRNSLNHPVELIQHITQVSVLLVAMPKEGEEARRIGFDLEAKLNKPSNG